MQILTCHFATLFLLSCLAEGGDINADGEGHHHHHHHHHAQDKGSQAPAAPAGMQPQAEAPTIIEKIKHLESVIAHKEAAADTLAHGTIQVSSPLPPDFRERFVQAAAKAADRNPVEIRVVSLKAADQEGVVDLTYEAPSSAVFTIQHQAADPNSQLAHSPMRSFLMARDDADGEPMTVHLPPSSVHGPPLHAAPDSTYTSAAYMRPTENSTENSEVTHQSTYRTQGSMTPGDPAGIDIDTMMPYGELEPFGREDTAQELTEHSVKESDAMVDQLERAEVAEEKRSVFRALTRLRGAAITSFDGIARSQTGNIDEYNKVNFWRKSHPLHHLADEESDISKWAFPDNADF